MSDSRTPSLWSRAEAWYAEHRRPVTAGVVVSAIALLLVAVVMIQGLLQNTGVGTAPSAAPSVSSLASVEASTPPSASARPSTEPTASAASSAAATPSATGDPDVAAGWSEVAAFGTDGAIETVSDLAQAPFGLIAVGVKYQTTQMPVFGPVAMEGRVWRSEDGRSWDDVTPAGTFADSEIYQVVALPDGAVVAFSRVGPSEGEGAAEDVYAAWETVDGVTWSGSEISFGSQPVLAMTAGGPGFVSVRARTEALAELWFSADGRSFRHAHDLPPDTSVTSLEGGPEGFVAVAVPTSDSSAATVLASGDGLQWYTADPAPENIQAAVPLGPNWSGIAPAPPHDVYLDATTTTWSSGNGLDWTRAGSLQFQAVGADDATSCREFLSRAIGTGSAVVVSTVFSYPCSEGGVVRFGASSISADGATWVGLPFTASEVVGTEHSRGATVTDGLEVGDLILLVGERDHRATFWVRTR